MAPRRLHPRLVLGMHAIEPAHAHGVLFAQAEQLAQRRVDEDAAALGVGLVDGDAADLTGGLNHDATLHRLCPSRQSLYRVTPQRRPGSPGHTPFHLLDRLERMRKAL